MTLASTLFNASGDKKILYREYLDQDVWTLAEGAFIVSEQVPIPDTSIEEAFQQYSLAIEIRSRALDACLGNVLKSKQLGGNFYVRPKDFLKWFITNRWKVPSELAEVMKTKKWTFRPPPKPRSDTCHAHKLQVQTLGKEIAEGMVDFNQQSICDHTKMKRLLGTFVDDVGSRRVYTELTIKKWLSEVDPRQGHERRGRPKKRKD